jgi:hypothetical protein
LDETKFGISSTFKKPSSMWRLGGQQEPHEKNDLVHASSIHGGAFVGAGSLWRKKVVHSGCRFTFTNPKDKRKHMNSMFLPPITCQNALLSVKITLERFSFLQIPSLLVGENENIPSLGSLEQLSAFTPNFTPSIHKAFKENP